MGSTQLTITDARGFRATQRHLSTRLSIFSQINTPEQDSILVVEIMPSVLFVCTGNICRSPIAEATFRQLAHEAGHADTFYCDSAATHAYHIGELADERTRRNATQHGLSLTHRARKLAGDDFARFDYIVAMDEGHLAHIKTLHHKVAGFVPNDETVFLLREFDPQEGPFDVPDPFYEKESAFEEVYQIVYRCNQQLLAYLLEKHHLV